MTFLIELVVAILLLLATAAAVVVVVVVVVVVDCLFYGWGGVFSLTLIIAFSHQLSKLV